MWHYFCTPASSLSMKAEKNTCRRFSLCLNKFSSKCSPRERSVLGVFQIEKFRMKIQFKTIINLRRTPMLKID